LLLCSLAELPKIRKRFDKGQLSFSTVRAITRIADASNEDYLLMIADHGSARTVFDATVAARGRSYSFGRYRGNVSPHCL
jgi:hypothetical protein